MSQPLISVVIPAYNEEGRLRSTLQKIISHLSSRHLAFEILVVDDGSRDRTSEIARALALPLPQPDQLRVLRNDRNRGKGYSVRRGMLEARGTYALLTDADLSTPIEEMAKLELEVVAGHCDIALGSRDLPGSKLVIRQPWWRETAGKIFNRLMRLATGLRFRDTQCGFKLFRMQTCRAVFEKQRIASFGFDVEVLYIARRWGLAMKEIPVVWRHASGSKVRFFPDAVWMFVDLILIRLNDAIGRYRKSSPAGAA